MAASKRETFRSDFRRSFLAGLGALFPAILTIFILIQIYKFVDNSIGVPTNRFIKRQFRSDAGKRMLVRVFHWKPEWVKNQEEFNKRLDEKYPGYIGTLFGVVIACVAIYFVGHTLRSFVGRKLFALGDRMLTQFPVVKTIYPHAKQLTAFFFRDETVKFNRVVAVQYPRPGIYSIGFITGDGMRDVARAAGERMVSIFIPSSPTPVTGYVIMVPEREVVELDMTIDQAFRYTITGGVIPPASQVPRYAEPPPALPPLPGLDDSSEPSPPEPTDSPREE